MQTKTSTASSSTKTAPKSGPDVPTAPKKRTGVTRYDPEFAILICERIATIPQSIVQLCWASDMPSVATLFRWLRDHPDFREMYVLANIAHPPSTPPPG